MEFDVAKLRPSETGRLLTAIVVPRPIAWTITQSPDGTLNAAPFSFFNVLSDDPPLVGLGLGQYGTRVHDTTLNIHQTCEFVVNLVAEKQIEAMNITAAEFEPHDDELKIAAVGLQPSVKVKPPRIADSPVSLECELMFKLDVGPKSSIIIGRVVFIHVQDEAITDASGPRIDTHKMQVISRMGGGGLYGRTHDTFNLPRFTLEDWKRRQAREAWICATTLRLAFRKDQPSTLIAHMSRPWNELSAIEAADAIARGDLTSEQLVLACLERIDGRDHELQAWAAVDRDRALAEARIADHSPRRSPLHGVPVGIKDIVDTADYDTAYNSPIYIGHRPKADAACVSLLKRAGCVILGKTVTTEFANITPAHTRNPHDLGRSPGGSSSGSAAAVADFMVPLALGTQTAGSTIRPASYCGALAIKPTLGALSRVGVKTLAESLDTIGLFARSPGDLAALLGLLSGWSVQSIPGRTPRVGICRTGYWHLIEPETASAIEAVVTQLASENIYVFDVNLPAAIDELSDDHAVIMGYESARALAWELSEHSDKITAPLAQRLQAGWTVTRQAYDAIIAKAAGAQAALASVFEKCDFLLTPSCAGEAPPFGTTGDSKFNRAWTLLGNPCIALPIGKGASGLPLGMQLVGSIGQDMEMLAWAGWVNERLFNKIGGLQDRRA